MMKRFGLLFLLLGLAFGACEDDDEMFDVPVPTESITFEAVPGGAVMRYTIPDNPAVYAYRVRYTNERGEEATSLGTRFEDTLALGGFNAPREAVRVNVSLIDKNNVESEPEEMTFRTLASVPYAFLDSLQVVSSWGGFRVESSYTGSVTGLVNVYRVGVNPYSGEIDTLYLTNFSIPSGQANTFISMNVEEEETTLVLKTEDANGYAVRQSVYTGLTQHAMELYPTENLVVSDPGGFSQEIPTAGDYTYSGMLGIEYLTDGDKTGVTSVAGGNVYNIYTYATNVDGRGSYVQVELAEAKVIATVRLYGMYRNIDFSYHGRQPFYNGYQDRLPNHVKVWATNDPAVAANPEMTEDWVELADFYQNPDGNGSYWPQHNFLSTRSAADYANLTPYYADVTCDVVETEYKYLRVQSLDHFYTLPGYQGENKSHYISYHELEVYVKRD